jgi:hypothetical protein
MFNSVLFSRNILGLLLAVAVFSACNNSNQPPSINSPNEQIWYAPAYGLILELNLGIYSQSHQWYQLNSEYCQHLDLGLEHSALMQSMQIEEDGLSMITTVAELKVPGLVMSRIHYLPDVCTSNHIIANKGQQAYQFDAQRDFEIFWLTFAQHYAFFDLEGVDWDEVYQLTASQINVNTSEPELVTILQKMITPLKDFHVFIRNPYLDLDYAVDRKPNIDDILLQEFIQFNQVALPLDQPQADEFELFFEDAMGKTIDNMLHYFADQNSVQVNQSETVFWGELENNIGYLHILSMELSEVGDEQSSMQQNKKALIQTLDKILEDFSSLDGVIIDVRLNGGGDDFVSSMFASRFFQTPTHVYSKQARLGETRTKLQKVVLEPQGLQQFSGPLTILTSSSTSSAAEVFAMVMRERPNTILIGEDTGGGLSDILPKSLPHGTEYSLSNEFYLSPTGESFEGVGVPVDIEQAFITLEQRESKVDWAIEKAIEWLLLH